MKNRAVGEKSGTPSKYVRQIKPETGKALPKFQQDVEDVANTMNSKHNEFRDVVTRANKSFT